MNTPVTSGSASRPPSPPSTNHRNRRRLALITVGVTVMAGAAVWIAADPAWSAAAHHTLTAGPPAAPTLDSVITGLRNWLVGLLAAVATLFLTIGGIRYITAGGDPMHVERAKTALKSAAIGYALAALAPLLVSVLRSVVG
jgi:Na+-transporting NADH:ubiquinone oxidoreductase subunit NqrB